MKFGLFAINMGPCSDPVTAVRVAQAAEAAGFESVWTGEHIVLPDPDPQAPASPVPHGIGHRSKYRLEECFREGGFRQVRQGRRFDLGLTVSPAADRRHRGHDAS